jgi:dipeptidyl aminopeptidase/acylaminoacyl peptidase
MSDNFVFRTSENNSLNISVFGIENIEKAPCVFLIHGFKGFKDWGFWPYVGKTLSNKGFFVCAFNFSHNGIGDNPTEFTEGVKFAQNTFSLEIAELSEIIDAYLNGFFGKSAGSRIGLIGHSRGGGIALLTARQKNVVNAVAVWASISDFDRYSMRQKEQWRMKGFFEILNSRTKQVMRLNLSLLEDIENNKNDHLNIEKSVSELKRPLLIIHGEQDLSVTVNEGERLYNISNKNLTEFIKIPSTGHTFDIVHPFRGSNPKFEKVLNSTIEFFNKNLK